MSSKRARSERVHSFRARRMIAFLAVLVLLFILLLSVPYWHRVGRVRVAGSPYDGDGGLKGSPLEHPYIWHDSPTKRVDAALRKLEWGNIAFTTPDSMRLHEEIVIELVVSPSKSIEQLQAEIRTHLRVESDIAQLSDLMEATLAGNEFRIREITPKRQAVSNHGTTRWKWSVVAAKRGVQYLDLTLTALVLLDGERHPRAIQDPYHREIRVEVTLKQWVTMFFGNHWTWVVTVVLIPTSAVVIKRHRAKRAAEQERRRREQAFFPHGPG